MTIAKESQAQPLMQPYHDLMQEVALHGQYKPNRTGTGTYAVVGRMLKYDLRRGFPAITTKKLAFKSVVGELLGFFRGYESAAQFRELGCKVWDQNANETASWVNSPYRKGVDDLGRVYGSQWTRWRSYREARNDEELQLCLDKGYAVVGHLNPRPDGKPAGWITYKEVNQLEEALKLLITDPYSRRIRVTGWRPDEIDQQSLPSCHAEYQWVVMPDGTMDATLTIRSNDLFLGHGFNVASFAIFTHILARLSGHTPGVITIFVADAHVYENHVEQVREQVAREHFAPPQLVLSDRIKKIERVEDIAGVFERIEPSDIWMEGYESHATISAPMAA